MTQHITTETSKYWFRCAEERDLEAIENLSDEVQALHAKARPDIFRKAVAPDGRRALFRKAILEDTWHLWICGNPHETLGYAMGEVMHKDTGPIRCAHSEAHIHQICVTPQARRKGLATSLVRHLLADLNSQQPDRITVAYWTFNSASERFFEKMGFAPALITAELTPNPDASA